MDKFEFRKAQRIRRLIRMALEGPSGSGKTMTALLVAFGICGKWEDIGLIDTENNSGDLYANYDHKGITIGEFNTCPLSAPYKPEKYVAAIKAAESAGLKVLIIDSFSHAWAGEGGLLDMQGRLADSGKANPYTAWRTVTPKHNALVEAVLNSKCHIIVTMRSKTEYAQGQGANGKTEIKKLGAAPIQRDGVEYEFDIVLDLSLDHNATSGKDRSPLFDGECFIPSVKTGEELRKWYESGKDIAPAENTVSATGDGEPGGSGPSEEDLFGEEAIIRENMEWCKGALEPAETVENLQTNWQKVKESEQYKILPEGKQAEVRKHCNGLKLTMTKNDTSAAQAA